MWLKPIIKATPIEPEPTGPLAIDAAGDIVKEETSIDSDELIAELPSKTLVTRESLDEFENTYVMVQEINAGAPAIKIIGVGNGGANAVVQIHKGLLPVPEYWAINTDAQHLFTCDVPNRIAIGSNLPSGLDTRASPGLGRQAAEKSRAEIAQAVGGADLVFIAVGMGGGGGTGTGASPVVAQIAKESGALVVGVASRPFGFEAATRIQDMSDPESNIIFGTCRDPRLEDEIKITMVAAAFPVLAETRQMREQELERLLSGVSPLSEDELDVPSLRPPESGRSYGNFH